MQRRLVAMNRDELRPEYDLSQLKGGVRGKYYQQATAGTNLVLIEPDLAQAFADETALRPRRSRWFQAKRPPRLTSASIGHVNFPKVPT